MIAGDRREDLTRSQHHLYLKTSAGIIWDSGAASIKDCQVLVDPGMTYPNSKFHSSSTFPLKRTRCSSRNFSMASWDVKLSSRATALHLRTLFGTRASCSTSGLEMSVLDSQRSFPDSDSRRFIQFLKKDKESQSQQWLMFVEHGKNVKNLRR